MNEDQWNRFVDLANKETLTEKEQEEYWLLFYYEEEEQIPVDSLNLSINQAKP
jgi:hypothetical protein